MNASFMFLSLFITMHQLLISVSVAVFVNVFVVLASGCLRLYCCCYCCCYMLMGWTLARYSQHIYLQHAGTPCQPKLIHWSLSVRLFPQLRQKPARRVQSAKLFPSLLPEIPCKSFLETLNLFSNSSPVGVKEWANVANSVEAMYFYFHSFPLTSWEIE